MIEEDIHSCGYHCDNPACIKAQRDNLRDNYFRELGLVKSYYSDGWNNALDEAVARIGEITAFGKTTQDSFAVFIQGLKN
jgi:hypothetical protein